MWLRLKLWWYRARFKSHLCLVYENWDEYGTGVGITLVKRPLAVERYRFVLTWWDLWMVSAWANSVRPRPHPEVRDALWLDRRWDQDLPWDRLLHVLHQLHQCPVVLLRLFPIGPIPAVAGPHRLHPRVPEPEPVSLPRWCQRKSWISIQISIFYILLLHLHLRLLHLLLKSFLIITIRVVSQRLHLLSFDGSTKYDIRWFINNDGNYYR